MTPFFLHEVFEAEKIVDEAQKWIGEQKR